MPCITTSKRSSTASDIEPWFEPIGTRDIDSTPPPIANSASPLATFPAARFTASRPEEQNRLICIPATVSAYPATITAVRAITAPCSPTGSTQPRITSSISAVSIPVRSRTARSAAAASCTGVTS